MATKPNDDSSLSHTSWNCKYHIVFAFKNIEDKCSIKVRDWK